MSCPHLRNWTVSSCKANKKPYIPSLHELQEYCTDKRHKKCPLYADIEHETLYGAGVMEERDLSLR